MSKVFMWRVNLLFSILIITLLSSCEKQEQLEPSLSPPPSVTETINGLDDPQFMELMRPLQQGNKGSRLLQSPDYNNVKKVTGDGYINYTLPIRKLNDTPFASHALILSERNDTLRYNLLEIIPSPSWNGKMEDFTGKINTYRIEFSEVKGEASGRMMPAVAKGDCLEFIIEDVIVHADLSATVVGYWDDSNCVGASGGEGSTGGGGYYWEPVWGSGDGDSGNWSNGDQIGSGGSGGSSTTGDTPKEEVGLISLEEYLAEQLETVLEEDPYALIDIDCDELEKWQDVSSAPIPQSVHQRLSDLEAQTGSLIDLLSLNDDWEVQDLEGGNGTAVNMDLFSVNVKLPPGVSPEAVLEKIRTDFLDNLDGATFTPHPDISGESKKWMNSSTSLGSILSIDMLDDGSVICIQQDSSSWIFTTIQDPRNFAHPVSGNRAFGFYSNADGSYTFYTRGVDRMTNLIEAATRDLAKFTAEMDLLDLANPVWKSFQAEVSNYVAEIGGTATIETPVVERPDYDLINEFLSGQISIEELKNCE